jgi:hypothetical protein
VNIIAEPGVKGQRARHAYRDPHPRQLLRATVRPAELPGHRIVLTTGPDEPRPLPPSGPPIPGPGSVLDAVFDLPLIAVQSEPDGPALIVRRHPRVLFDRWMARFVASLLRVHELADRMCDRFDQRAALLKTHFELKDWARLDHAHKLAGQLCAMTLVTDGPAAAQSAILAHARQHAPAVPA